MVNEERTKRYSWGVEATTSLFLEGGLLVVCNRLPFVGSLYGRARIRTEYARRRFASRYGLFRPAGSRTACGKGGTVPFVRHRGNVQSVERHAVFTFVNPGMGLSFRLRNADRIYLGLGYQYMWRHLYPYRFYSHNLTFKFGYRF